MTAIAVYYDPNYPGLYVSGVDTSTVYPPGTLSASADGGGNVSIWIGNEIARVAGPMPFGWVTDQNGGVFASAALTLAYLLSQFSQGPASGGGAVIDSFAITVAGAMTKNYSNALPVGASVFVNGLLQDAVDFTV